MKIRVLPSISKKNMKTLVSTILGLPDDLLYQKTSILKQNSWEKNLHFFGVLIERHRRKEQDQDPYPYKKSRGCGTLVPARQNALAPNATKIVRPSNFCYMLCITYLHLDITDPLSQFDGSQVDKTDMPL
jgi:hypothetical protein